MKNYFIAFGAVLLMTGFYAFGSTPVGHSKNNQSIVGTSYVTDTVPKKGDTTKKWPKDTTTRKDTLRNK